MLLTPKDIEIFEKVMSDPYREIIAELIDHFAPNGVGIEIGVYRAEASRFILTHSSCSFLHMIDPWKFYLQRGYHDMLKSQERADEIFEQVKKVMQAFSGKYQIYRNSIGEIVDDLPSLDFAFIDGNHSYEAVTHDLNCIFPKIKSKGLIAGHDWSSQYKGVVNAVCDFFNTHREQIKAPFGKYSLKYNYQPAPHLNPIVNKSWPLGHIWWTLKK